MSKTILVIDDDPLMLMNYESILRRAGYEVIIRRDGQSALSDLREGNRIDLVISDYSMPGMDGMELIARVKEVAPGVPVILCSLHMGHDMCAKGFSLGVSAYLRKPFSPMELIRAVSMSPNAH